MSDIKIVRLSTGEELIASVKYDGFDETPKDDILMLEDVAILIPTEANQLGIAPFMAYSDAHEKMALQSKDVMFVANPVDGLKKQYQNMFNKIITPANDIIT